MKSEIRLPNADLLDQVADRFVTQFRESENVDFVLRLKSTAEDMRRLAGIPVDGSVIRCRSALPTHVFLTWIANRIAKVLGQGESDRHVVALHAVASEIRSFA